MVEEKIVFKYFTRIRLSADKSENVYVIFPDACDAKPCLHDSVCHRMSDGRRECLCEAGFYGEDCGDIGKTNKNVKNRLQI